MKIIPLILCRGGSKGIPRKNIAELNGKPLLSYVLTEALKVFPKVYLSTEDTEIAEVATRYGATVLTRPLKLAQDDSQSIDTVKYHLIDLRALEGKFEAILLINACTPFTKSEDIQGIVDMYYSEKCDSVVSLVSSFDSHPSKVCNLIENKVYPINTGYSFQTSERQQLTKVYKRNTALYLASKATIRKGSFFGKNTRGFVMSPERSFDINTPYDFWLCELILKHEATK